MGTTIQPLSLKKYLSLVETEMGLDTFCKRLKANRQSLYQWKLDMCLPNARKMKAIVEMSGGRVSYKTMIDDFVRAQARSRKKSARKTARK